MVLGPCPGIPSAWGRCCGHGERVCRGPVLLPLRRHHLPSHVNGRLARCPHGPSDRLAFRRLPALGRCALREQAVPGPWSGVQGTVCASVVAGAPVPVAVDRVGHLRASGHRHGSRGSGRVGSRISRFCTASARGRPVLVVRDARGAHRCYPVRRRKTKAAFLTFPMDTDWDSVDLRDSVDVLRDPFCIGRTLESAVRGLFEKPYLGTHDPNRHRRYDCSSSMAKALSELFPFARGRGPRSRRVAKRVVVAAPV